MTDRDVAPSSWRLGCQARPWLQTWGRDAFAERLGDAMRQIADVGFAGFETALACLPLEDPTAFAEMSARAGGLVLSGAHTGGRWWDAQADADVDALVEQAVGLPALRCDHLVVSVAGLPADPSEEQLDQLARNLGRLGRACREKAAVRVAVHNHAVELADDARVLRAIVDRCSPEDVGLGADLGWVAYAGVDVTEFVERFGSRLDYLHLRDVTDGVTDEDGERGFTEVGRGSLDFPSLVRALATVGFDGWLVAESELTDAWRGEAEPERTARAQYDGLRRVLAR